MIHFCTLLSTVRIITESMKKLLLVLPILIFFGCGGSESSRETTSAPQASGENTNQAPQAAAVPEEVSAGQVYERVCLVCHQKDGMGVPNMYPPLTNTEWVEGDKERLIKIVLNGLDEPMTIKGEKYTAIMPAQDYLSNQEIADVLTYVRSNFNNNASAITAEEVAAVRQANEG